MLQVSYIREHQAEVIERLSKRTNEATSLIDAVLKLDELRRGLHEKASVAAISAKIHHRNTRIPCFLFFSCI